LLFLCDPSLPSDSCSRWVFPCCSLQVSRTRLFFLLRFPWGRTSISPFLFVVPPRSVWSLAVYGLDRLSIFPPLSWGPPFSPGFMVLFCQSSLMMPAPGLNTFCVGSHRHFSPGAIWSVIYLPTPFDLIIFLFSPLPLAILPPLPELRSVRPLSPHIIGTAWKLLPPCCTHGVGPLLFLSHPGFQHFLRFGCSFFEHPPEKPSVLDLPNPVFFFPNPHAWVPRELPPISF